MRYILDQPLSVGLELVAAAFEEYEDRQLWEMWLQIFPYMSKDDYISFEEYKAQVKTATTQQVEMDTRTKEEIMDELMSEVIAQ